MMKNFVEIITSVITNVVSSVEENVSNGYNRLLWSLNLPIFGDEEGNVIFRTMEEEGIILPEDKVIELINAEASAREALDAAMADAAKILHLDGWIEAEEQYKTAKTELIKEGRYGLPMEEIPFGKEVAEFRKTAAEKYEPYRLAQQHYWDVQPTAKRAFYTHKNANDYVVKGLNEFFATPVFAEDHPFAKTYWEEIRALLPNWAIRVLRKDAQSRVAPEKRINYSNGTWDSNSYSGRSRDAEEKTEKETLFNLIMAKVRGFFKEENTLDFDKSPEYLLKRLEQLIKDGDASPYAIAYKLIELVNTNWITAHDLMKINGWDQTQYDYFKEQYDKDVAINNCQRKTRVIDMFVGEWYSLGKFANLEKEDIFNALKEGMVVNTSDYYAPMLRAAKNEQLLWTAYSRIPFKSKKDARLKKVQLIALAPNFNELCDKAISNLQSNDFALRKLAETSKYEIKTDDPVWDAVLIEVRDHLMTEVGDMSQRLRENYSSVLVGGSSDVVTDIALVKAAYMLFKEAQEQVETCFGTW